MNTTQIFAHRAQLAARNKPRWQPYSQSTSTLPTPNVNTPKPSSQPPPVAPHPNIKQYSNVLSQAPKDQPVQRDVSRQKFALGLIDQAVKTLSEIWRPEDIPTAFVGPTKGPSSTQSPPLLVSTGAETTSSLLPLKNFVHEVLRRSRTSGSILQTALCYLEAVRSKIPDISRDEKRGLRCYFMPESTILPATEAELEVDKVLTNLESQQQFVPVDDVKTVCQSDQSPDMASVPQRFDGLSDASSLCVEPACSTVVSASLPSPLLCPRRTFLAALILASKFSQDKCYSNRAWAKLLGLPPREIGRCERALGQALDWRLWVGKKTEPTAAAGLAVPVRTGLVGRTQSESCISSSPHKPFLQPDPTPSDRVFPSIPTTTTVAGNSTGGSGLRRCATLPTESFVPPNQWCPIPVSAPESHHRMSTFCIDDDSMESINSSELRDSPSKIGFPYVASESSSSNSSPRMPSLSNTPSTSGTLTIQVSSFEDGNFPFPNGSQPYLEIGSVHASPSSFIVDPKLPKSAHIELAGKLAFEMAQLQAQIVVANAVPDIFGISPPGIETGGYLLHADGSHVSLGLASVH